MNVIRFCSNAAVQVQAGGTKDRPEPIRGPIAPQMVRPIQTLEGVSDFGPGIVGRT